MKKLTTSGLRHIALNVKNLEECVKFYTEILNMRVEWQPDNDNYYLTSGNDNLALHRADRNFIADKHQHLDHLGFILQSPEAVDDWYQLFLEQQIAIKAKPKTHRDGARSFYATDPDGNLLQMIYHPPLASA